MIAPRYIVFDDAPQGRGLGWTADQFADALRFPLGEIGVRVVRHRSAGPASPTASFQARGCSRGQYNTRLDLVDHVVDGVVRRLQEIGPTLAVVSRRRAAQAG